MATIFFFSKWAEIPTSPLGAEVPQIPAGENFSSKVIKFR